MVTSSGAGSEITALAESLQAYACATRQFLGKDLTSVTEITEKTIKNADCDRTLDKCIDGLNAQWFHSVIVTANKIAKDFKITKASDYIYYRGGDLVGKIYSEFSNFRKTSGIVGDDKWNPADIWMAKKNFKFKGDWPSLEDYNRYIYDCYQKNELVGISLKLVPKGDATSKVYNDGKPITAKFSDIKINPIPIESKDVYIQFLTDGNKSGEIQLRNFSSRPVPSSWQGEIKGKTAAGGKVGGGLLIKAAQESGVPNNKLTTPASFSSKIEKPPEQVLKDFTDMFCSLARITNANEKKKILQMVKVKQKEDTTWWLSKFLGVAYCYAIVNSGKVDDVTKWIYGYGSSATKNSSIFIKYS
jgi:hypothetical protein